MKRVRFNGAGESDDHETETGSVILLVQQGEVEVVRVKLRAKFGVELTHAANQRWLAQEAKAAIARTFPEALTSETAWTVTCPPAIADKAHFRD